MKAATLTEAFDNAPLNYFHKRLLLYSSGGPFLDGYVLSIIGIALIQATPQLDLSIFWQGLVGASALIGIFLGGFIGGWFTDKYGRQILYTIDLIAIGISSLAQFWVESPESLFFWRLILGIAVGADYPIATSLLAEFTPKKYRGPFLGALNAIWFVGAAVAYIVGDIIFRFGGDDAWRWMLASAALPTFCFVIMRRGTPESPRWLMEKGLHDKAMAVLIAVLGKEAQDFRVLPEKETSSKVKLSQLFHSGYGARMVFVTLFWTCTVVPLFAVYAFGPKIMVALGLTGDLSNWGSSAITVLFATGCIAALFFVNRIGRRSLLIGSFFLSGISLLLLGLFPHKSLLLTFVFFSAYALFTGGSQILQFVYPNELFPTEIRASAVGLASSLSRIGAAIGTYLVPWLLITIGIGNTMLCAAAITLFGFLISIRMAPETRGVSLEICAKIDSGQPVAPANRHT